MHYLLPAAVVDYIEENGLYLDDGSGANVGGVGEKEKGKERDSGAGGSTKVQS